MKKESMIYAAMVFIALMFCACDTVQREEDEERLPEISLDKSVLNVGEDGGVFEIGYNLSYTVEGGTVKANSPVDWITMADNGSSVIVTVAPNGIKEARDTSVTVEYWLGNTFVADSIYVEQDALSYDHKLVASNAVCEYSGDMYGMPGSLHNYYLMVSDLGWDVGNAKVYKFDIFLPEPDNATRLSLPAGEYLLSGTSGTEPMTFTKQYSMYSVNNQSATENISVGFTEGKLMVERQGNDYVLDAVLTDVTGETHHMTYSGPIDFEDYYEPVPEVSSILTEDYSADLSEARLEATYDGDYYGYGTYIWYLHILNEGWTGDSFIIELCSPYDDPESIPEHEYAISLSGDEFTAIQGYPSLPFESGSWLYYYDEDAAQTKVSPLNSGVISVTHNDDGTTTVEIDCMDDNLDDPHKITGVWTGTIVYKENPNMTSSGSIRTIR